MCRVGGQWPSMGIRARIVSKQSSVHCWRRLTQDVLSTGAGPPIANVQCICSPPTPPSSPDCPSLLHLQVVQFAGLRAGHESRPVHRDAHQRARRVERAAAFLELQCRALALSDLAGSRRVERAAFALALLDELQAICVWLGWRTGHGGT